MWAWLSKIDPNTVVAILSAVGAFAYHLVRRDTAASAEDQIRGLGKQVIHLLVTDPGLTTATALDELKARTKELLVSLAKQAKIPTDNAIVSALLDQTAEHIVGDVLAELRDRDRAMAKQVTSALDKVSAAGRALEAQAKAQKPDTAFEGTVTIQPDGSVKRDDPDATPPDPPKAA